ncbi:MAG: hypothetical protein DCC75_01135, partial [Proteobacteria bacterium]
NLVGNRQTCAVNLAVSDGTGVSQCSAEISFDEVPICVNDRCGVPCGDGMSCCGCVQVDNSAAILALGTNYSQLDLSVKKTTRLVRRLAPKGSKSAKLAKKTSKALSDLRLVSRSVLIGLPSVMTDCTAFFVVKSNNQGALQAIDDTANQYQILNNKLAKQAKKEGLPVRKSGKAVIKNALGKLNQALSIIPAQDESCNTP